MSTSKMNMSLDDLIKSRKGSQRGGRGRGGRGRGRDFGERRRYNRRSFDNREGGNNRSGSTSGKGNTRLVVSNLPKNIVNNELRVYRYIMVGYIQHLRRVIKMWNSLG